jgi:polyhydroxybutyrate depolymerase
MLRFVVFLLLLLGCQWTIAQTTKVGNIMHGGLNRNYRLRLPANHNKNVPIPLVFNMHGFTSNAAQQELYSAMNAVADTARFAVCYPNGVNNAWNVGWSFGSTADDVGFIAAMIDQFHTEYGIDKKRVYACGMSNGGFMSYRLACELNDRIAAIASVTGSMVQQAIDICEPSKAVPIMEIHGTADETVNYNGTPNVSISIAQLLKFWQLNNGCDIDPTIETVPNISTNDNTTSEKWTYTNCDEDKKIVHFKVINGAHTWPGAPISLGNTSQDFKASVEIWRFFKQYQLENTTSIVESTIETSKVFPNPTCDMINIVAPEGSLISVKDFSGRNLVNVKSSAPNLEVSTFDWVSGIYFVHIQSEKLSKTHKLIKI